jgi:hypothetical protein
MMIYDKCGLYKFIQNGFGKLRIINIDGQRRKEAIEITHGSIQNPKLIHKISKLIERKYEARKTIEGDQDISLSLSVIFISLLSLLLPFSFFRTWYHNEQTSKQYSHNYKLASPSVLEYILKVRSNSSSCRNHEIFYL